MIKVNDYVRFVRYESVWVKTQTDTNNPKYYLKTNTIYTVKTVVRHSFYTSITLNDTIGAFNIACFELVSLKELRKYKLNKIKC